MNIQIFGTKKCNDTKKAERFFKERGIKFQFIDMKEKGMSKGEFNSVAQAFLRCFPALVRRMRHFSCRSYPFWTVIHLSRYCVARNYQLQSS